MAAFCKIILSVLFILHNAICQGGLRSDFRRWSSQSSGHWHDKWAVWNVYERLALSKKPRGTPVAFVKCMHKPHLPILIHKDNLYKDAKRPLSGKTINRFFARSSHTLRGARAFENSQKKPPASLRHHHANAAGYPIRVAHRNRSLPLIPGGRHCARGCQISCRPTRRSELILHVKS